MASLVPAAAIGGIIVLNYEAFWKYAARSPEHFSPDPPYAMHIDKFSHFYISAAGSDLMRYGYREAGLSEKTSAWVGASVSLVAATMVEVIDGLHGYDPEYGFSPGDWGADLVGCSLPVLRSYFPELQRLTTKLSMWPSDAIKGGAYKTIADDYESQFYWLSLDVHDWLGLPPWLNVAAGFSAENLAPAALLPSRIGLEPRTLFLIAPDINLRGLPIHGAFWEKVLGVMDYIRIPSPALQIGPRLKWWWLR